MSWRGSWGSIPSFNVRRHRPQKRAIQYSPTSCSSACAEANGVLDAPLARGMTAERLAQATTPSPPSPAGGGGRRESPVALRWVDPADIAVAPAIDHVHTAGGGMAEDDDRRSGHVELDDGL